MHQFSPLPSGLPASDHGLCHVITPGSSYSTTDEAYANSPLQLWSGFSYNPQWGTLCYSPDLSLASFVPPSHFLSSSANTMTTTNPCQSLSPSLANPPAEIKMRSEAAIEPDAPYSELIYAALQNAPGHKLSLEDIYMWFEVNTTKEREQKGWRATVRYNLSQNPRFELVREQATPGGKRYSCWGLTNEALMNGIQIYKRKSEKGC
ncbi:uncharacterized protein BJX67DRAFT_368756 [Aspergillus lucknowensis]|uniref:Fork-head domain-containing protein n=1 Tax=Aspergillus lucknowensis TaxID=176173 RepID=A0ABR4L5N8_9EURO